MNYREYEEFKNQITSEKLKENNQMEWVKLMNNFKIIAEEIVEKELIVDYFSAVEQNLFVFLRSL